MKQSPSRTEFLLGLVSFLVYRLTKKNTFWRVRDSKKRVQLTQILGTCTLISNKNCCPTSHPYHQRKDFHHASTTKKNKKHSSPWCNSWMKHVKNCAFGVIFLRLSVLASINLKRLMSQVNLSVLGWFSLSEVFNPIFYAVHCASWRMAIKKYIPFPPNQPRQSRKEAPWCFEESPLECTSWQCDRRISCYSSAQ